MSRGVCLRCRASFASAKLFGWHLKDCILPVDTDFLLEVLCVEENGDCLIMPGMGKTIPKFGVGYKITKEAHYILAEESYGPRPPGTMLCHRCDNRRCVKVEHLYWGTASDNATDAWRNSRRGMSAEQLAAMADGLRRSRKHKERMVAHNRALAEKQRGDGHWTRRSPEQMARWKAAITKRGDAL